MNQRVDLVAAFLGLKFLPMPLVIGTNNLNPKLMLRDAEIEYRAVFRTVIISYEEIEQVDVFLYHKTTSLCISRRESVFTFAGNLNNRAKLIEIVRFLQTKNCPLSQRALALVQVG